MMPRTATEDLALAILTRSGIGTIWRLHTAAAEVYQIGNPSAAAAILELADAAEREWVRVEGSPAWQFT
jgi:hypothetical protein